MRVAIMKETNRDEDKDDDSEKGRPFKTTGLEEEEGDGDTDAPSPGASDMPSTKKSPAGNTSLCSTSTTATAPFTPMTSVTAMTSPYGVSSSLVKTRTPALERRRRALNREALLMILLAAMSFSVFLYYYLPLMALIALGMFAATTCLAFYLMYERFMLELDNLIQGRGIGDYLPQSVYLQLAEMSLHEWMMDSTLFNEYRHLALYYVPGISNEQLQELLERLPPRRREMLQRRGLGQFFGDDFMRILMGEARWQPPPQQQPLLLHAAAAPAETRSRGAPLTEDDAGDTDVRGESPPVRSITAQPLRRRLYDSAEDETSDIGSNSDDGGPTEPTPEQEDEERNREWGEEGQILTDAFYEMAQSYSQSVLSSGTQSLRQLAVTVVDFLSPLVIGMGVGTTTISTSVGLLGVWYGAYYPGRTTASSSRFPAGRFLMSTAVAGGVAAGLTLLIRRGIRRALQAPDSDADDNKTTEEDKRQES